LAFRWDGTLWYPGDFSSVVPNHLGNRRGGTVDDDPRAVLAGWGAKCSHQFHSRNNSSENA
jgi:hypothetical protein